MTQSLRPLPAVLSTHERAYARLDGHIVLVDAPGDDATAISLDGTRANQPEQSWYDTTAQMEQALPTLLAGYVPGAKVWQPAEANLEALLEEWHRHRQADGYTIGLGYVQFDDCSLCREFGWSSCTGHDYDPDALDRLEEAQAERTDS